MPFQIGRTTYADADAKVKITPLEGPNANSAFTIKSKQSAKMAPNAEAVVLQGSSGAPVSIVPTEAAPEWEVGLSAAEEAMDLAVHLQGDEGGACRIPCKVEVTWWRPGMSSVVFEVPLTYVTKGLGFETDSGSAPKDTIGGKCTDIQINGVSVLRRAGETA